MTDSLERGSATASGRCRANHLSCAWLSKLAASLLISPRLSLDARARMSEGFMVVSGIALRAVCQQIINQLASFGFLAGRNLNANTSSGHRTSLS